MTTRTLGGPPATLPLYAKAALPAIPLLGRVPGVRHRTSDDVPDLTLVRRQVSTEMAGLAAYARVCGFGLRNELPPTYPHLAAFGLQLALMTDTSFPFAPMGLVHVANTITQHRPIGVNEVYDLQVHAENLRPHPRGRVVDLVSQATIDGAPVWQESSTYLSRGGGDERARSRSRLEGVAPPSGTTEWRLDGDLGRRYGAVSGDRNPIHLYRLSAKALGFRRQIVHGLWTKARCLAALDGRLPHAYRVDVEFRKPIALPGSVAFGTDLGSSGAEPSVFAVTSDAGSTTHLLGRVSPAD